MANRAFIFVAVLGVSVLAGCFGAPSPPADPAAPEPEGASFAPYERTLELEPTADVSANAAIGDVDGDGNLDVLLVKGRHWPGVSKVFLGDGRGGFPTAYDLTDRPYRSYSGSLVDLDGDGALDVVLSNDAPDPKVILLNDGTGMFGNASSFGKASWPTRNAATADFDGDGDVDVVLANRDLVPAPQGTPGAYLCLNEGDARLGTCRPVAEDSVTTVTPADVDGDGRTDLIVPARDVAQSYVYVNGGNPMFSPTQRISVGLPIATARMAGAGDFDEDGLQDIVLLDEGRRAVEVHRGQEGGSFGLPEQLDSREWPYALLVADLDQDGHTDILVGYVSAPSAAFFGDGSGAFTRLEFGDSDGAVYGFAVADLDVDGHLDVVAARSDATSVIYFGGAGDTP